ncbi:unnamed protein product [Camellia sinensis]
MGAKLCCFKPTSPKPHLPKGNSFSDQNVSPRLTSSKPRLPKRDSYSEKNVSPILTSPKPCLPKGDSFSKKNVSPGLVGKKDIATLGECILASPERNGNNKNPQCITGSDLNIIKQLSKKVYLSSPDLRTEFFAPKTSFSSPMDGLNSRKPWKIGEGENEFPASSGNRGQGDGKVKKTKKVSFKLPQEADIIIFYSPREIFDERDE